MKRIILTGAIFFLMLNAVTAACLPGYTVGSTGLCISPGMFECPDRAHACPTGTTCNGTRCEGNVTATGPMCGGGPCMAGWLCSPAGCYDPNVGYACGEVVCIKGGKYLPGSPCGACQPQRRQASPRQLPRGELKDAVADKPRLMPKYIPGLPVRDAIKVAPNDWSCKGIDGYPEGASDNQASNYWFCRPAYSKPCTYFKESYACPWGYSCYGSKNPNERCRKNG